MIYRLLPVAAFMSAALCLVSCRSTQRPEDLANEAVGQRADGAFIASTRQVIRPAGNVLEFNGRPVDLALSPDGKTLYGKDIKLLLAIDVATWQVRQQLALPEKATGTMHGIAVRPDGGAVYVGAASGALLEAKVNPADG